MKKLFFIALFAIGLTTTVQAQCLDSDNDFYLSGAETVSFGVMLDYGSESVEFIIYSDGPDDIAARIDNVWYYNIEGHDYYDSDDPYSTIANADGYGWVNHGGYTYDYYFERDSNGNIDYVGVCRY